MRLLNAGCGGQRPQDECWFNCDNLRTQLKEGTPERKNLDAEPRYIECNLLTDHLPFADEAFDGILLQHVIEHFTCHEAVDVIRKLRRVLKKGGLMLVTVPDAEYFLRMYGQDTKENAVRLFGEPIHDEGFEKFFDYALFRHDHKQILTVDALICLLWKSGFNDKAVSLIRTDTTKGGKLDDNEVYSEMEKQLTRRRFSIEIGVVK